MRTLNEIINNMETIYNNLASEKDKIQRELNQIQGAINYITECNYIPEDIRDIEVRKLYSKSNVLIVKLMCEIEKEMKEMRGEKWGN